MRGHFPAAFFFDVNVNVARVGVDFVSAADGLHQPMAGNNRCVADDGDFDVVAFDGHVF